MQKYFISNDDFNKRVITGDDVFHIKNVMRGRVGDNILVSNGNSTFLVEIKSISSNEVAYELKEEQIGNHELPVFVSIFQGYPKGDKIEDIIKHGTELGAYEFIPTMMKRCIVKLDDKKKISKVERFNKIAKEASEQSYRDLVPKVLNIKNLKEIDFSDFDLKIVCFEEIAKNGELTNFKNAISKLKGKEKIAIVIGPEGGIDDSEIKYLLDKGFIICGLGPRILRTESVVFYCLSAISYELELKKWKKLDL